MSGSGMCWAMCKSAPHARQITMPAPHHSVFTGRMPFLPPNIATVCLHINWKVHAACDLNFIVKAEGLLNITDNHIHWKSGNISEKVLDRDVVTTGHNGKLSYMTYVIAEIVMTLGVFFKVIPLLQTFSSATFRICGMSHGPSALLIVWLFYFLFTFRIFYVWFHVLD